MRVRIDDTIYIVIEKRGKEVCILQTFPYADGTNRQAKIWVREWELASKE